MRTVNVNMALRTRAGKNGTVILQLPGGDETKVKPVLSARKNGVVNGRVGVVLNGSANGHCSPVSNGHAVGHHSAEKPATSAYERAKKLSHQVPNEKTPILMVIITLYNYIALTVIGYIKEYLRKFRLIKTPGALESIKMKDFVPLFQDFDSFYIRNIYRKLRDLFENPICSVPGAELEIMERTSPDFNWTYVMTGRSKRSINLGSYNYLGFAENSGSRNEMVEKAARYYGNGVCSTRQELGNTDKIMELERLTASFLGVESAITFSMGFATNSLNIPALVTEGCLVISDKLNHSSLVLGIRLSGASVKVFEHNDPDDLEKVLRDAISSGRPRTHQPWKKILVVVEGIYSMEGSIVRLPQIVALKKKYKFYLYVDEAHSIGALGPRGKGVTDFYGIDPKDIDILMGTFTKSFGACGGYIGGRRELVEHIRKHSHSTAYGNSLPAPIVQQIISSMTAIMGEDGTSTGISRIRQLAWNTKYMRHRLRDMKFIVIGHDQSPVIPVMMYMPTRVGAFNRMCRARGVGTVAVGFPATPIIEARIRICLSAAHTKEMLDKALEVMSDIGEDLLLKQSHRPRPQPLTEEELREPTIQW
ncbi:serine palmitoyltransferase 2-like [Asterias rubens]|uniref:serine palmitoyltransferase 2-like n=1 Tax=Asterias rubens TaxID=7604 RepID=UPI00145505B3|nr:serine palmitoyltransferase 2-like [Asterias rubens]